MVQFCVSSRRLERIEDWKLRRWPTGLWSRLDVSGWPTRARVARLRLCVDLEAYLLDPEKAEAEGVKKCFNLKHTMLGTQPVGMVDYLSDAPYCPPPQAACCREVDGPRIREVGRD